MSLALVALLAAPCALAQADNPGAKLEKETEGKEKKSGEKSRESDQLFQRDKVWGASGGLPDGMPPFFGFGSLLASPMLQAADTPTVPRSSSPRSRTGNVALDHAINLQTLQTLFLLFTTLNNHSGMIEFDECKFAVLIK
jgi:hypothetical protein